MEEIAVIWTETTKKQLQEIYLYIAEESILQADKVFNKLVEPTAGLSNHPKKHPLDRTRLTTTEITGPTNYSITGFRTE